MAASVVHVKPGKGKKSKPVVHGKKDNLKKGIPEAHRVEMFKTILRRTSGLLSERKVLLAQKADFDTKYCSVDVKNMLVTASNPFTDKLAINDMALQEMRSLVRSSWGTKSMPIMLHENWSIPVSALGVMNTGTFVDPSGFAEFNACATLFDEYRVSGGTVKFELPCFSINNATNVESQAVLAYDPDGTGAVLTSVAVAAAYTHHTLVAKTFITAGSLAVLRTSTNHLEYKVPPGILIVPGAAAGSATSAWQPTVPAGGVFMTYGTLRAWGNNLSPVSLTGFTGLHTYHVHFRCRE